MTCPFSPLNQTGAWENEVQEVDGRRVLFEAVREHVQKELGFELYGCMSHRGDRDEVQLTPGCDLNTVRVYFSADLLNDLLYHPEVKHGWTEMVQQFYYILAMPYGPKDRIYLDAGVADKRAFCLDFWGDEMPREKPAEIERACANGNVITSHGLKVLDALDKLFKRACS